VHLLDGGRSTSSSGEVLRRSKEYSKLYIYLCRSLAYLPFLFFYLHQHSLVFSFDDCSTSKFKMRVTGSIFSAAAVASVHAANITSTTSLADACTVANFQAALPASVLYNRTTLIAGTHCCLHLQRLGYRKFILP